VERKTTESEHRGRSRVGNRRGATKRKSIEERMAARGRKRGGSLGNIDDLFKRKRAEGEEGKEVGKEEIFKKSIII